MLLAVPMMCGCWGGGKAPRAFSTELSSSDSLTIQMGNYALLKYHSDRLGFDINYPDFLIRQDLPEDAGMQELFMMNDVSVSFMVDCKVINSDSLRQVTIILRYYPEHAEAVEPLKEWVRDFKTTSY